MSPENNLHNKEAMLRKMFESSEFGKNAQLFDLFIQ